MKKQKGISTLVGVIIIIVVAIIAFGGVFAYQYFSVEPKTVAKTDQTAGWKTYKNDDWGISFQYPSNWQVQEFNEKYHSLTFKADKYQYFLIRTTLQDINRFLEIEQECLKEGSGLCYEGDLRKDGYQTVKNILEDDNLNGKNKCFLSSDCNYCEVVKEGEIKTYQEHQCMGPGGRSDLKFFLGNSAIFRFDFGVNDKTILSTFKFTK